MCLLHCSGKWSLRNYKTKYLNQRVQHLLKHCIWWSAPGIVPRTSSTQRKNHTSRPSQLTSYWHFIIHNLTTHTNPSFYRHSTHLWPLHTEGSHSDITQLQESSKKNKTVRSYHQVFEEMVSVAHFFYAMHSISELCEENITYKTLWISIYFFY